MNRLMRSLLALTPIWGKRYRDIHPIQHDQKPVADQPPAHVAKTSRGAAIGLLARRDSPNTIVAACHRAAMLAGWTPEEWRKVEVELKAGDAEQTLNVALKHFDIDVR